MMAHPLLMDNSAPAASSKKDRYKPMTPKFSTTQANNRAPAARPTPVAPVVPEMESLVDTPYFDPRLSYGSDSLSVKSHMGRGPARETLKFNPKGKFVRLGEGLRAEAKMEELKKRILESARKAGLESEMEDQARIIKVGCLEFQSVRLLTRSGLQRAPPPEIEWWDAPFLPEKTYDSFSPSYLESTDAITIYIQHPIQIPAPQDKIKVEPKALFLTKKEQKKMRRQRRAAALRDKQDRIKMGLLPPDAPRGKSPIPSSLVLSLTRLLLSQIIEHDEGVDAGRDRGSYEGRGASSSRNGREGEGSSQGERRSQVDRRGATSQDGVEEGQGRSQGYRGHVLQVSTLSSSCSKDTLTHLCRVRYLSDPAHKAKVRNNALQDGLTGIIIYNPKFCLIVVEGGAKGLRHFRNLMLRRIDWTAEARAREGDVVPEPVDEPMEDGGEGSEMGAMGELAAPASLADNTCSLVWEGQHRERMFMRIRQASCPSDSSAKEALGAKLEGLWDVAKSEVKDDE